MMPHRELQLEEEDRELLLRSSAERSEMGTAERTLAF